MVSDTLLSVRVEQKKVIFMPVTVSGDLRQHRADLEFQRYEAFELWQREHAPIQDAREILDPHHFMYWRAAQLVEAQLQKVGLTEIADPMTDLLGGARMVLAFEEAGKDSSEAWRNHRNDVRTAFTEALLKGGHVSETETELNEAGQATIGNLVHWEVFLRAAAKSDPTICAAEVNEEFLSAAVYNNEQLRDDYYLAVISPSRPDTKGNTMMVRFISFEQTPLGRWIRHTQQLYLDNSSIEDANALLRDWGMMANSEADRGATAIVSQPLLLRKEAFPEGVVAVGAMLDTLASERLNQPVFCGTPMKESVERSRYTELPAVSRKREQDIDQHIQRVSQELLGLVSSHTLSFAEETNRYKIILIEALREICNDHPEYASSAFGEEAAKHYQAAFEAKQRGDFAMAQNETEAAHHHSNTVLICDVEINVEDQADEVEANASLAIKYGQEKLRKGLCMACQRKGDLGPCGFCNDCDTKDRRRPGYIQQLIARHNEVVEQSDENVTQPISLTTRRLQKGKKYRIGDEQFEYNEQISFGSADPIFVSERGNRIEGEAAHQLWQSFSQPA